MSAYGAKADQIASPSERPLVAEGVNKILKLEFGSRSEAVGKLTEQQSECLNHEIQTNPQHTES